MFSKRRFRRALWGLCSVCRRRPGPEEDARLSDMVEARRKCCSDFLASADGSVSESIEESLSELTQFVEIHAGETELGGIFSAQEGHEAPVPGDEDEEELAEVHMMFVQQVVTEQGIEPPIADSGCGRSCCPMQCDGANKPVIIEEKNLRTATGEIAQNHGNKVVRTQMRLNTRTPQGMQVKYAVASMRRPLVSASESARE